MLPRVNPSMSDVRMRLPVHPSAYDKLVGMDEHPRNPNRNLRLWIEYALLAVGLTLLAIYGVARVESFLSSRAALRKFATLDSASSANSPRVDFSLWDEKRVQAYNESLTKRFDAPLAVLQIPSIHLEVPVLDGTDDLTLNRAVGRITGTTRPGELGNIGIAGHRDGFFRGLKDVAVGDAIELKTLKGIAIYVVDRIQIVTPDNVYVLHPRPVPSVTLVTCYPFYFIGSAPQRYIVSASLIQGTKQESGYMSNSLLSGTANLIRRENE